MSFISDIIATTASFFKIGLSGVRLKNSSGNLLVRNSSDSADAQVTASMLKNSGDSLEINSDAADTGTDRKLTLSKNPSASAALTVQFPPAKGTDKYVLRQKASTSAGVLELELVSGADVLNLGMQGGTTNLGFSYSVASNAGTIALTDAAGSTPSTSTPVSVTFQDGDGTLTTITQTSSLTLTFPESSTVGSDGVLRLWVVIFNDGGTLKLGGINCRSGKTIYPLREGQVASSTAVSSSSNSAGVFYTASSVTTKYFRILGYIEIDSWTPGTWKAADRSIVYAPGMHLPGDIVQSLRTVTTTRQVCTGNIPIDNTIPQNTEGTSVYSVSFTPTAVHNIVTFDLDGVLSSDTVGTAVGVAFFKDSNSSAFYASLWGNANANYYTPKHYYYASFFASTSTCTFSVRVGSQTGNSCWNGLVSGDYYGGVLASTFLISEVMG